MEENKKKQEEDVKIYDKEVYISQEKIKTIILIIAVFLIGFLAGYFSKDVINETIMHEEETNTANYDENSNKL